MGPLFWRHPEHGLKKCAERTRDHCTDHEDCCSVTACGYCIELEIYGEQIQHGFAEQDENNHWIGTVGNHSFDMYWHRMYDECFLFVLFDGEEVYAKTCYEGVKCRDSSDETEVTIGYDEGVLRWKRHEPLPLPHIVDPDTGCKTWYCDDCDCSCETLCATITEPNGRVQKGELDNVAYECEPPIWEGQIGYYDLSLALDRDIYGRCIIVATVDGEEQTAVLAPGCKNLSTIIELYDGTTIEVVCKICECKADLIALPCCGDIPITAETLNIRLGPGLAGFGPEGGFEGCSWEGSLAFVPQMSDEYGKYWAGVLTLTAGGSICTGVFFYAIVYCDTTNNHTLCVDFSWRNAGWTMTPLDGDCFETGWQTDIQGGCGGTNIGVCAPLGEFSETFDENLFASCSPLVLYNNHYLAPYLITELALP